MSLALHYDLKSNPTLEAAIGVALTCGRTEEKRVRDADGWLRPIHPGYPGNPGAAWSENMLPGSENLSSWVTTNCTNNTSLILFNGITLTEITDDATDGKHGINTVVLTYIRQGTSFAASDRNYIMSVYCKAGTSDFIGLAANTFTGVGDIFQFSTETWTKSDNYSGHGFEDLGDGYYRIWLLIPAGIGGTPGGDDFQIIMSDDGTNLTYSGSGDTVFVGGAMLEEVDGKWSGRNDISTGNTEDLNGTMSKTNVTIVNAADSINGINLASFTDDATDSGHHATFVNGVDVYAYRIMSCYCHGGTGRYVGLSPGNNSAVGDRFDTQTGEWVDTNNGSDHGAEDLGNGYWRIWFTIGGSNDYRIYMADDTGTDYIGSGSVIYVGGVQIEYKIPGRTTPTNYVAVNNSAAVEYLPSTYVYSSGGPTTLLSGANDGLLYEPARTNLCLQSEDFTTTWTTAGGGAAITSNDAIAPDGSLTADRLGYSTGTFVVVYQSLVLAQQTTYVASIYAKADTTDWLALSLSGFGGITTGNMYWDLTNGVVGTPGADITDSGIEDFGDGWYRCWAQFTTDNTDANGQVRWIASDGDGDQNVGSGDGIFIWGSQVEAGLIPSSYCPTTTGTQARDSDDITAVVTGYINPDAVGTWYVHANPGNLVGQGGSADPAACRINGDSGVYYTFGEVINGTSSLWLRQGGGSGDLLSVNAVGGGSNITRHTDYRLAFRMSEDDAFAALDGDSTNGSDTACDLQDFDPATLTLGFGFGASEYLGLIKEIRYYTDEFAEAVVEEMSLGQFPAGRPFVMDLASDLVYDLGQDLVS